MATSEADGPARASALGLAACGLIGGVLSGLLGIGGGTVMVPLLVLWLGHQQREAHAMSLAAIIPISLASLLIYGGAGHVDMLAAAALTLGAVGGARAGAGILARIPERPLKAAFGSLMIVAAIAAVA